MRKWQRDRVRRRKKTQGPTESGQQVEPLQPIYPDFQHDAAAEAPAPESSAGPESPEPVATAPEQPAAGEAAEPGQRAPGQPARRRRRRGGRGTRGQAQQPAAETATESVPAPEVPPEVGAPEAETAAPPAPGALSEVAPELPAGGAQPRPGQRPQRPPKGVVVLTIGLPGSGKTSWFKRRGVTPLSSDLLRTLLFDNITEQRYQGLVFGTLRSLLRARLIARMPWNYVDATNLSPKERAGWIKMAREFGYEVHAVFFDVPVEVCMDRNRRRDRTVPEEIMQQMASKLRPPSFDEGFTKIIVVRVKKRDEEPVSESM